MNHKILKSYLLQSPTHLDQAIGFNIAMNSSPCPCSSLGVSIGHSPLEVYIVCLDVWMSFCLFWEV